MKKGHHLQRLCICLMLYATATGCSLNNDQAPDPLTFQQPDSSFAIHTWWHWMDNAITREGITADLEAMKGEGIATATILNISLFDEKDLGVKPVIFNTPEWYEMFRWALEEASRLGITIGVHNCDGWSTSGGPWITPEQSMKQCVWSRIVVQGDQDVSLELPIPRMNRDFYRDIAVLAYPAGLKMNSFRSSSPEYEVNGSPIDNVLCDGDPFSMIRIRKPTTIDINCSTPIAVSQLAIHPRKSFQWGNLKDISFKITVEAATGKAGYQKIAVIDSPGINETTLFSCPTIISDKFRLTINNYNDSERFNAFGISEFELLEADAQPLYTTEIPYHLEKIASTKAKEIKDIFSVGNPSKERISPSEIIDLTSNLTPDGVFSWKAPAGNWNILRIGYTTTGSVNGPSTKAGNGLECDKMDTTALNHHFSQFSDKLVAEAGAFTGNTFEYIFVDSWECGYQNWTGDFPAEFEKRRGYSLIPWLPVIAGEVVEGQEETERFLHDYRQTISDLIEHNYFEHFNTLCHRLGVDSHAEVIYGGTGYPPLDVLKTNKYVDVPMFEFWAGVERESGLINYNPVKRAASDMPMQAANLYGQKVVPAEAYTGYANYSESPWDLKLYGDRAFCSGVNEMVLHSFVHQPDERIPGTTLGGFGQTFNRHNPWWKFASQWFTYHARVQYMLQQGVTSAGLLCYIGDRLYDQWSREWEEQLTNGYGIQKCNSDILLHHAKVKDGLIRLDNGISYRLLLLPNDHGMELSTLQQIAKLVKEGACVSGPKPTHTLSMLHAKENDSVLIALAENLWGEANSSGNYFHTYGKGRVYGGQTLDEVIAKEALQPDFATDDPKELSLLWIHKKIGENDLWFVVNQEDKEVTRHCLFRATGSTPQIWDPQYGSISSAGDFKITGGITRMSVTFPPKGSLFFLFGPEEDPSLPIYGKPMVSWTPADFSGSISFQDLPDKAPVTFTDFKPYQTFEDPDIKYYSGEAVYTIHFDLPDSIIDQDQLYLSLGKTDDGYEVVLNDHPLGTAVFPNYRFPITSLVKPGINTLEVHVGNCFRNRIINERMKYGELKDLWTTSPMHQLPKPGMPLRDGGISGPVRLMW